MEKEVIKPLPNTAGKMVEYKKLVVLLYSKVVTIKLKVVSR